MKAFVSVDMEGMPFIVSPGHLNLRGPLYDEARRIATKVTVTVADELHKNGFDEVVVADSHGPMVNIMVDDLPEYVDIVRGYPRPLSMISGAEGCDAALLLGYHAKFGTAKSTFDHTYSGGTINRLEINGVAASEFLLSAYATGERGVPVMLVAGEAQLLSDDVATYAPWAERVPLKHSFARVAARTHSMTRIEKDLRQAVRKASSNLKRHKMQPLKTRKPVKTKVTFLVSHFADVAELSPNVKRIDGLSVEFTTKNVLEAYKMFELLVLASNGVSSLLADFR